MAPGLIETSSEALMYPPEGLSVSQPTRGEYVVSLHYEPGQTGVDSHNDSEHSDLLPRFPDIHWPVLQKVLYHDRGLLGDPQFRNLLSVATDIFDYNPKIGTEIHGVRLSQLTHPQKNDLARLIAIRGVVFFRSQDDFDIEAQRKLGSYFGTLHKHATTSVPRREGLEDVHVIHTEGNKDLRSLFTPTFLWHSDLLTGPPRGGGGDTLWTSQYAAYDAMSPFMQIPWELDRLALSRSPSTGLSTAWKGSTPRSSHHPTPSDPHSSRHWMEVSFFNPGFVTKIVGVPKIESDHIIGYLNEVVATTNELHARFQWSKNDVAIWDNRVTVRLVPFTAGSPNLAMSQNHTASYGFAPRKRHAVRVCCHGEKPVFDAIGRSQEEDLHQRYGLPLVNKDGSGAVNYND